MKNLILIVLSMFTLAACGKSNNNSASTAQSCTYQNGGYYSNNSYVGQTCPYNTANINGIAPGIAGIGNTGTHNCANLTMTDMYGNVGVCSYQVNYCAGYMMYYQGTQVRCY